MGNAHKSGFKLGRREIDAMIEHIAEKFTESFGVTLHSIGK